MYQHFHITMLLLDKAIYIILQLEGSLEIIWSNTIIYYLLFLNSNKINLYLHNSFLKCI